MSDNRDGKLGDGNEKNWLSGLGAAGDSLRKGFEAANLRTEDELQRRRIWAGLSVSIPPLMKPRPALRWQAAVVLGCLVVAAGVLAALGLHSYHALVKAPSEVAADPSAVVVQKAETFLEGPTVVSTGGNETMRVRLRGGTRVALGTRTRLLINSKHEPELALGHAVLEVPKQARGQKFKMTAGPYQVVVLGTRFAVDVSQQNVAVQVEEGVVEVTSDGGKVRLLAGQNWTGWPMGVPRESTRGVPTRGPAPRSRPDSARTARASASIAAQAARQGPSKPQADYAARSSHLGGGGAMGTSLPETLFTAVPDEGPQTKAPKDASAESADLARQAREALAAGDPDRALALLQTLARQPGAAGENASYEMGRIWLQHKLQPQRALAVWQRYQQQHPHGLLRAEVDLSVVETWSNLGDAKRARQEAEAFLRRHPNSERRAEVQKLLDAMRAQALNAAP